MFSLRFSVSNIHLRQCGMHQRKQFFSKLTLVILYSVQTSPDEEERNSRQQRKLYFSKSFTLLDLQY